MGQLTTTLSQYWNKIQGTLFPWLAEEFDPLTRRQSQLNLDFVHYRKAVGAYWINILYPKVDKLMIWGWKFRLFFSSQNLHFDDFGIDFILSSSDNPRNGS